MKRAITRSVDFRLIEHDQRVLIALGIWKGPSKLRGWVDEDYAKAG
jgi:hypothetical protein